MLHLGEQRQVQVQSSCIASTSCISSFFLSGTFQSPGVPTSFTKFDNTEKADKSKNYCFLARNTGA